MKIVIDLTSLSYHMTGIERYASCISEKMLAHDSKNEYFLLFRNDVYPSFSCYIDNERIKPIVLYGNNKLIFLQVILPKVLNSIKADKYLFFAFPSPLFFRKKGIVNTIHDMGAWDSAETMKLFQKIYWRTAIRVSSKRSERIITVSNFSKTRITEILKYPIKKIDVVYSAVDEMIKKDFGYSFAYIRNMYSLPDRYIMALSTLEPRKNIALLLEAFKKIQDKVDYDLVLVGRKGWMIDEIIEKYNYNGRIHITGFVKDQHVSLIYKNAMCFVFPSLYEGFGLPPVEALSLGTPVISSNAASLPEVLRKQAFFFSSNDINALESLLVDLEKKLPNMPHGLDEYQKQNFRFDESALKILNIIGKSS